MNRKIVIFSLFLMIAPVVGQAASGSVKLSAADFGDAWPFTVPAGVLSCEPLGDLQLVTFTTADGKTYAINGTARSWAKRRGWSDGEDIGRKDPKSPPYPQFYIPIGPMLDKGFALCK